MAKKVEIIVTNPTTGDSKKILVTSKECEHLFRNGVQANNVSIPVHIRVAHVFRKEIKLYFELVEQGIPKCRAFKEAFKITSETPILIEMLDYVRREECKDVGFAALFNSFSATRKYNNAGKPITNVDANNEFYGWWGAQRLKSGIELRVASVRFMKFTSHLLWDEEFQRQVRAFV